MQKTLLAGFVLVAIGVAYSFAQGEVDDTDGNTPPSIAALQQQRIELLQKRVAQLESLHEVEMVDRTELIRPRMDLINARLEYARSNAAKKALLTELIAEYDTLIQLLELAAKAPVAPPQAGQRPTPNLTAASDLLLLKADRIKVQIERNRLE